MDEVDISNRTNRDYNQKILAGCAFAAVTAVIIIGALLVVAFNRDRQSAQYPGSQAISAHSNYRGLPRQYRWDNTYRTGDSFTAVYNWYSTTYDLGAESRANGKCILLEGSNTRLSIRRQTSVLLCNVGEQQMIYVTRSTILR